MHQPSHAEDRHGQFIELIESAAAVRQRPSDRGRRKCPLPALVVSLPGAFIKWTERPLPIGSPSSCGAASPEPAFQVPWGVPISSSFCYPGLPRPNALSRRSRLAASAGDRRRRREPCRRFPSGIRPAGPRSTIQSVATEASMMSTVHQPFRERSVEDARNG